MTMLLMTLDATVVCTHQLGHVDVIATQSLVKVEGRPILVAIDPENRPISGCPMTGPGIKPCTLTLKVKHGYSPFMKIEGHRICLDSVRGFTDGTPPGAVEYVVRWAGQNFVSEKK
jgi:hypothetical protein